MSPGRKAMPTVAVIGLGYIGLPTAAILANAGLDVIGVDVSPRHVEAVNRGELPFAEEGLGEVVSAQVAAGRLRAQAETPRADIYIVAVPTRGGPVLHRGGGAADRPEACR